MQANIRNDEATFHTVYFFYSNALSLDTFIQEILSIRHFDIIEKKREMKHFSV